MGKWDAVIIGSGFGGLSTAALLVNGGKKVVVLEREPFIGGRAHSLKKDGFILEYGYHGHRYGRLGNAWRVFASLHLDIKMISTKEEHHSYVYFRGRLIKRPENFLDMTLIPVLNPMSRLRLIRLLMICMRADPAQWYDISFKEFFNRVSDDGDVEAFLSLFGLGIIVPDIAKASAGEVIYLLKNMRRAKRRGELSLMPVGGSRQEFDKLSSFITKNGGTITAGEVVTQILLKGRQAIGVKTDRGQYEGENIIYAAPLDFLFQYIHENLFSESFINYCRGLEGTASLYLDFIFDHPITKQKVDIMGLDPDAYIYARTDSNFDPSLVPAGKHSFSWLILLDHLAPDLEVEAARKEKAVKDIAEQIYPGFMEQVTSVRRLLIPRMNGVRLTPAQSYPHRPAVKCDRLSNLYFVGDTVRGSGCSSDISFDSAWQCAELILNNPKP